MVRWTLVYTTQAKRDAKKLVRSGLKHNAQTLLAILEKNPFQTHPPYEKLVGELAGAYSRRITIQHRLVYEIINEQKIIKVIRMWTHYE